MSRVVDPMNRLQQIDENRSQPMDVQRKACRRDGRMVSSWCIYYLSRLFQATLTLVTTMPREELSAAETGTVGVEVWRPQTFDLA
jgi:hypothetical protein